MQPYDVFISSSKSDYSFAWQVCNYLSERGLTVFFCEKSLPDVGVSDYAGQIYRAIEQAKHMVVVTSSKINAESRWVRHEWDTFHKEYLACRKDGNLVTVVAGGLSIEQLPIVLRNLTVFTLDEPGLRELLLYLRVDRNTTSKQAVDSPNWPIKSPNSQERDRQASNLFKRHWLTVKISISVLMLVVAVSFAFLSLRSRILSSESITPTEENSTLRQDPQVSTPASVVYPSGSKIKPDDTPDKKVDPKGDFINRTDSSPSTIEATKDANAAQSTLPQNTSPIIQEEVTAADLKGATFYINGPDNDDANLYKVANQVRQELNTVGRRALSPTETRYSVRWSDARIGKDGPDNRGEYVFFIRLKSEIIDTKSGKSVRSFFEEESISGRDQHAPRILDSLVQNVAHRIAQRLIQL